MDEVLSQSNEQLREQVETHERIFRLILNDIKVNGRHAAERLPPSDVLRQNVSVLFEDGVISHLSDEAPIKGFHVEIDENRADVYYGVVRFLSGATAISRYDVNSETGEVRFKEYLIKTLS